ncbi:MAG TPA: BMP family ABC transporter substrate-binding protein [Lachnospiraceae bacterium]|nr:BMP family ABC transporter substrate-binding protein [Lachnospiraceae bacterium]
MKMRKALSLVLACMMALALVACGDKAATGSDAASIKIGVILVGDETEGYTKAHMDGIKEAAQELGIADNQIIWKYKVQEDSTCYDAAVDLVGQGCNVVFSNSYGHQTYMVQAAQEYTEVTFVSMTGDFAAISGCENLKNAFTSVFESRYVSGVVAGMKLKELLDNGTLTADVQPNSFDADGNVKIGYVGAFNYAEVVSGYTAFYLGIKSIVPNVVMEVMYTNSWFDIDKEAAAAEALVANGSVIIGQHADSTGAPAAVQKLLNDGTICYSIGYNVDMLETAPTAALTSATNNWFVYYKHAFECVKNGTKLEADWAKGYAENAVAITKLGESCAEGTADKVAEIEGALKDGSLHVFDTSTFTVGGQAVTTASCDMSFMDWSTMTAIYQGETVEAIKDGYFTESTFRSAPYFQLRIDGINEDTEPVK